MRPADTPKRGRIAVLVVEQVVNRVKDSVAFFAAVLPMVALALWMHVVRTHSPSLAEFFTGPLVIGGGMIFWLLFLHIVYCREPLASLGVLQDAPGRDFAAGVLLGLALLCLKYLEQPLLGILFPPRPPSREIIALIAGISRDPWLLALWLGPVVWIGVAVFEELWRVFVLRRLWNLFPEWQLTALLLVALLIGLAHAYQGPAGAASITVKALIVGALFLRFGRIWPLIVSHAVYDSLQIIDAVMAIRSD